MNDIVTSLRRMGIDWAADEIERLNAELATEKTEHHYTGLAAHAEAKQVDRLNAELAAAQAREEKLREELIRRIDPNPEYARELISRLFPTTDDSVLKERLAQERELGD